MLVTATLALFYAVTVRSQYQQTLSVTPHNDSSFTPHRSSRFCITTGFNPHALSFSPPNETSSLQALLSRIADSEEATTHSFILSQEDRQLYKSIFDLQQNGDWTKADAHIQLLQNKSLLGHVLFQRYMHPTKYRSSFAELSSWLESYSDLPNAERIYRLALTRKPADVTLPHLPRTVPKFSNNLEIRTIFASVDDHFFEPVPRLYQNRTSQQLYKQISDFLSSGQIQQALEILNTESIKQTFSSLEYDKLLTLVSHYLYHQKSFHSSLSYAQQSIRRNGKFLPEAYKIAGLSAWRLQRFDEAQSFFLGMTASAASPEQLSTARFWTARTFLKLNQPQQAQQWFEKASNIPRTFYGLMASYIVAKPLQFDWYTVPLSPQHIRQLITIPAGKRALLLLQLEEFQKAEQELLQIHPQDNQILTDILISIATQQRLPRLSLQLGQTFPNSNNQPYDAALYPRLYARPDNGYSIDHALLYAMIRQESRFQQHARSHDYAIGLMQILPTTAQWITQQMSDPKYHTLTIQDLYTASINLTLGQWYITYLLDHPVVNNNLLMLLAAYNGGSGNLRKWRQRLSPIQDSLLFLESLPSRETRTFIRRVLLNYWIYQHQFNQIPCSLDALTVGEWPLYKYFTLTVQKPLLLPPNTNTSPITHPQPIHLVPAYRMILIQQTNKVEYR